MTIPGNLLTTAMAVMPHKDIERAMEVALSMDIPFWPQLPNYSYYEDMYVQASRGFWIAAVYLYGGSFPPTLSPSWRRILIPLRHGS